MTGLVSVSFRDKNPKEIVEATVKAGLDGIEWGGDVHVPHGDKKTAIEVKKLCDGNGIKVAEYGSYYKIGQSEEDLYSKVLDSCHGLGTDTVRVWGLMNKNSDTVNEETYEKCVLDAMRICDCDKNITVCLECHPQSLTDEYHSALQFIKDVNRQNLKTFWQPNQFRPIEYNTDAILSLLPYIISVHTFSWKRDKRYPLDFLENDWKKYIQLLGTDKNYMLEFMHDGKLESLAETSKVLKDWLS